MDSIREELVYADGLALPVQCKTRSICPGHKDYKRPFSNIHYHEYIEFLYGVDGTAQVLVGTRVYTLEKGDLMVINAGENHDVLCIDGNATYHVVKFLPQLLYAKGESLSLVQHLLPVWQKEVRFHPAIRRAELQGSGVDACFEELMREWQVREAGYEMIMRIDLTRIFVWMLRNHCSASLSQISNIPQQLQIALRKALEETPRHLENWNADQAAKLCGLSYSYFSRNFKKAFGLSYTAYLESVRLQEAERMLLTTDTDITGIAEAVGFGTVSYFIERFRKQYGVSPRVFRERMKS